MKDKVLKLCRRLKCCTISDLIQFTDIEKDVIKTIIAYLEDEGLIQNKNGLISISSVKKNKRNIIGKNLKAMFQYRSEEEIEIILKGFCLEITPQKLCKFINANYDSVADFYCVFRRNIYNRQLKNLVNLFIQKPQIGRAVQFYFLITRSFGGRGETFGTVKKSCGGASKSQRNVLDKIDAIHQRLDKVMIENRDFEKLINQYDFEGAFI